ncbi:TPA: DUF1642 domain-containing protein [Streptococcus suis]|nr:DUF1642 domain-containing protein [Streptococcus suis]
MNKKEAIEAIEDSLMFELSGNLGISVNRNDVINIISQIHEPQKVVVPKFIGDLIEKLKIAGYTIGEIGAYVYDYEEQKWIDDNEELFYRAFLDGYEIEQEKLYVVTDGNKLYLKEFDELNAIIIIDDVVGAVDYAKRYSDKIEAQKAADELGWIVQGVE